MFAFFSSLSISSLIFANLATGTFVLEKREDVPVLEHLVCLSYTLINDSETIHSELHFPHFQGFSAFLYATYYHAAKGTIYNVVPQTPFSDTSVKSALKVKLCLSEYIYYTLHCMCGSFRILFQRKKKTTK